MNKTIILIIGILILIIGGVLLFQSKESTEPINNPGATTTDNVGNGNSEEQPAVSTVSIALLDPSKERGSIERGCDNVVLVPRQIPSTTTPLTAAMKELFAGSQAQVDGLYNFIANTRNTLLFDRAEVQDGTAKIYLTGRLSGLAGVCDNPRAQIQIEETALQFPTVERVEIYLNDTKTDLTPNERG
jgi:hypothetical protein